MSEWVKVTAEDGFELSAYVAKPEGEVVGAVVVVQEIFGVNTSIQADCERWASEGFVAVAPAIFDRFERDVRLGYTPADMQRAFTEFYPKLQPETTLLDVAAAFGFAETLAKNVGVLGYCYGGQAAWLAAVRGPHYKMKPGCCVGYYAGGIGSFAKEEPCCPVMLHFGADDDHIGAEQREAVAKAHPSGSVPEVEIFVYEGAGHAFANPARPSYVAAAAEVARGRTLEFLKANLG